MKIIDEAVLDLIPYQNKSSCPQKEDALVDTPLTEPEHRVVLDIVAYGIGNFGDKWAPRFQLCLLQYRTRFYWG